MLLIKVAILALVIVLLLQFLMQTGFTFLTVLPIALGIWIFMILQNRKNNGDDELEDY